MDVYIVLLLFLFNPLRSPEHLVHGNRRRETSRHLNHKPSRCKYRSRRDKRISNVCPCVAGRTLLRDRLTLRTSRLSPSQAYEAVIDSLRFCSYSSFSALASGEDSSDIGSIIDCFIYAINHFFNYSPLKSRGCAPSRTCYQHADNAQPAHRYHNH